MAAVALVLPTSGRASESANRVKCAANLSSVYKASYLYAQEHGGAFAPDLAQLFIDEDITAEIFTCPSSTEEKAAGPTTQAVVQLLRTTTKHRSYVYRGAGLTLSTATPQFVFAHDLPKNHGGKGGNVVYGDGRTRFLDAARLAYVIAELDSGHNPPRPDPANR
jgi:prepilin-type processing-associated H-X9-DG protein